MIRKFIVSAIVVCVLVFALSASAQNSFLEKLALYPVQTSDLVPPIKIPGETDDITWSMMTPGPENFNRCAIGQIGNYVYIVGNYEADDFAQAFNLVTESWEDMTLPPIDGYNWVGVTANGSMYVFPKVYGSNAVQKFTPTAGGPAGVWTQVSQYPYSVGVQTVAWDGGNFIYCAGGTGAGGLLANTYKYDIANDNYIPLAPAPRTLKFSGGAFIGGKFYVVGGLDGNSQSTTDLYEYDPAADTWTSKAPSPVATAFTGWATSYNDLYLFIVGGGGGYSSWPAVDAVQVYNPVTDSWFLEAPRPLNTGTNMAYYCGGMDYLIDGGGYDGAQSYNVIWKGTNPPGSSNPAAPASPGDFTVEHNNAVLTATLNWTNPSLMVNGQALTQLTGVKVQRDGNQIADLTNMQIGQPATYDDTDLTAGGIYTYRVVAYNDSGDGLPSLASAWIGLDAPGEPENVTATPDPNQLLECTVTWDAPTQGAHGGYWPAGSFDGQKVYRDGVEIADLAGTNNSYVDGTVPVAAYYSYGVSYYNSIGEGLLAFAPEVLVGPPAFEEIPYDWVEINTLGTNTGLTGDDQNLGPFPIGFSFPFYDGSQFNTVRVSSNGFVTFTATTSAYANYPIPTANEPNNLLAAYWDDLKCNVAGAVVYYYYDSANDRFIVEFENLEKYGAAGSTLTFEVILYPNGDIDYMYNSLNSTVLNSATVGIENGDGTVGLQATFDGSGPLEPQDNFGIRFYSVYTGPPPLSVTLAPYGTPIQIPANGGQFEFNISLSNSGSTAEIIDLWTMITLPNGNEYGPIMNVSDFNLLAGANPERDRSQAIPAGAPAGDYTYDAYLGDYPNTIFSEDHFDWAKSAVADGGPMVDNWSNWGEDFSSGLTDDRIIPTEFAFHAAYPNPFNPQTNLNFDIAEAGNVNLTVYDVQGRVAAGIIDGWYSPGNYTLKFDGRNLASGIYFAKLQTGEFSKTQKLMLIK